LTRRRHGRDVPVALEEANVARRGVRAEIDAINNVVEYELPVHIPDGYWATVINAVIGISRGALLEEDGDDEARVRGEDGDKDVEVAHIRADGRQEDLPLIDATNSILAAIARDRDSRVSRAIRAHA